MKKMICLVWMILFLPTQTFAEEKIETPVWTVGDKWLFTPRGTMEVVAADEASYTVKFSASNTLTIFDKSTLNRKYVLEEDKRREYKGSLRRILNFPLVMGKTWEDISPGKATRDRIGGQENLYFETFKVLGWEDVKVKYGAFRAVKIEYRQEGQSPAGGRWVGKAWFWYAPEAKYFVKCKYEKTSVWIEFYDWELAALQLK